MPFKYTATINNDKSWTSFKQLQLECILKKNALIKKDKQDKTNRILLITI